MTQSPATPRAGAELLACPFCGSPAICDSDESHDGSECWYSIGCSECNVLNDQAYDSRESAVAAWNRRAALQRPPQPAAEGGVEQAALELLQACDNADPEQAIFPQQMHQLRMALLNQSRVAGVPDGWKAAPAPASAEKPETVRVPVEPTEKMMAAGRHEVGLVADAGSFEIIATAAYRAMIAARPEVKP